MTPAKGQSIHTLAGGFNQLADPDSGLEEMLKSLQQRTPIQPRPLRGKACDDCAVACGFYLDYSEALRTADPEEQVHLSKQWFCHQTPGLACRGNADNLQISW